MVRESIAQTLTKLLGESGGKSTIFYIGLTNYEESTTEVHVRLYSIFRHGSTTIEKAIISDLYKRLNLPMPGPERADFKQAMEYALKVAHDGAGRPGSGTGA